MATLGSSPSALLMAQDEATPGSPATRLSRNSFEDLQRNLTQCVDDGVPFIVPRIDSGRGDEMEAFGIRPGGMAEGSHVTGQQEVERLQPIRVALYGIETGQRLQDGGTADRDPTNRRAPLEGDLCRAPGGCHFARAGSPTTAPGRQSSTRHLDRRALNNERTAGRDKAGASGAARCWCSQRPHPEECPARPSSSAL